MSNNPALDALRANVTGKIEAGEAEAIVEISPRDQAYLDIFITALEGGIGYWSQCQLYLWTDESGHPDPKGFHAKIIETEQTWDESTWLPGVCIGQASLPDYSGELHDHPVFRVDRKVIAEGVKRFIAKQKEMGRAGSHFGRAAVCLDWGKWDDLDIDAMIADEIVQLGLFGEAVYG